LKLKKKNANKKGGGTKVTNTKEREGIKREYFNTRRKNEIEI
jgi:hypothetical protein